MQLDLLGLGGTHLPPSLSPVVAGVVISAFVSSMIFSRFKLGSSVERFKFLAAGSVFLATLYYGLPMVVSKEIGLWISNSATVASFITGMNHFIYQEIYNKAYNVDFLRQRGWHESKVLRGLVAVFYASASLMLRSQYRVISVATSCIYLCYGLFQSKKSVLPTDKKANAAEEAVSSERGGSNIEAIATAAEIAESVKFQAYVMQKDGSLASYDAKNVRNVESNNIYAFIKVREGKVSASSKNSDVKRFREVYEVYTKLDNLIELDFPHFLLDTNNDLLSAIRANDVTRVMRAFNGLDAWKGSVSEAQKQQSIYNVITCVTKDGIGNDLFELTTLLHKLGSEVTFQNDKRVSINFFANHDSGEGQIEQSMFLICKRVLGLREEDLESYVRDLTNVVLDHDFDLTPSARATNVHEADETSFMAASGGLGAGASR